MERRSAVDMKKTTKGRQKIQMRLIEDKEDRVITFSKRKAGIFKKASEISVMCGAKVLFILFSPVGKAYSFAHPSVKSVADKFLGREESEGAKQIRQILESHLNKRLEKLLLHHFVARSELEAVTEQVSAMSGAIKFENKGWWEANVSEMSTVEEVEQLMKSISDFEVALSNHFEKLKLQTVGQGSDNNNQIVEPYDQLEDVNNFPHQMPNWAGDVNLSNVGALGVDNVFGGVNGAGLGYGGTVNQGNGFSMPAAGNYGDSLRQGDGFIMPSAGNYGSAHGQRTGFSMPAAGNYGGSLGQGDGFSIPGAGNYGSVHGQGTGFSMPAAGNYGGSLGQGNGFSMPGAGKYGGAHGQGTGFSMPAAGNYGGSLGQGNDYSLLSAGNGGTHGQGTDQFSLPAAGNYGGTLGQGNGFSLPAAGNYGGTLGQGNGFSLPAAGSYDGKLGAENCFSMPSDGNYGGTLGGENCFNMTAAGYGGAGGLADDGSSWPGVTAFNGVGLSGGSSSGAGYSGDNFGADPSAGFYGAGSFMDGLPDPASGFQGTY